MGKPKEPEHVVLENCVLTHIRWLQAYVDVALDGEGVRDALLYSKRQLGRLEEDFAAYQKLMTDRVHYAEGVADARLVKETDLAANMELGNL